MNIQVSLSQVVGLFFGVLLVSFANFVREREIRIRELELDDVKNWWYQTDWLHPTRTWKKIRNVARWIPLLWRDVDWDHSALYLMIEQKLKFMADHQRSHWCHEDSESTARDMEAAADSLRRVREDEYLTEEWERFYSTHPRLPMSEWKREGEFIVMPSMGHDARIWFNSLTEREEKLRVRDLRNFGDIFIEKSRGWWD